MAVLPMSMVNIFGVRKDRKKILEAIQRMGVVEVRSFGDSPDGFEKADTSVSQAKFQKVRGDVEAALEILERCSPEDKPLLGFLQGMKKVSAKDYDRLVERCEELLAKAAAIVKMDKEITDFRSAIIKLKGNIESVTPWKELEVPMNFSGTEKTAAHLGSFSESYTEERLEKVFD